MKGKETVVRISKRGFAPIGLGAALALVLTTAACGGGGSKTPAADQTPAESPTASASTAGPYDEIRALLPERIRSSGAITVSNPLKNPPYAYMETDGTTLKGIAPDLSKALEPILGVTFKWVDTPFPGLIPGLQANKFDMIWGSITDTKEREGILDFVSYEGDGAIIMVKKGNPAGLASIEDLCGTTASGLQASFQITMLEDQSKKCTDAGKKSIKVLTFPSVTDAELAVRSGKADSFFGGVGAVLYQVKTAGDGNDFDKVGPIYNASLYGAGVNKSDAGLSQALMAGLKKLIEEGSYQKVFDTYGLADAALTADQIVINGAKS